MQNLSLNFPLQFFFPSFACHHISANFKSVLSISNNFTSPHSHFTLSHLISFISLHPTASHLISSQLNSPHCIAPNLFSPHTISSHVTSPQLTLVISQFFMLQMSNNVAEKTIKIKMTERNKDGKSSLLGYYLSFSEEGTSVLKA